jgi:hypothetical protein
VRLRNPCLLIGLMVGLSAAASASAVHTSTSSYGSPSSGGVDCSGVLCNTVTGVTILEQDYAYSFGGGQVYDFAVTGLPSGTTGYTLELTGTAPFLNDTTNVGGDGGQSFGLFICPLGSTQCGSSSLTSFVSASIDSGTLLDPNTTVDSVTFTVSGDHAGIVFYGVVSQSDPVNAFLTLNTTSAVPEPRLWPILSLVLVGLLLLRWFRSAKLA